MATQVSAPMVGKVVSVDAEVGSRVEVNQTVVTIEAMKMKVPVVTPVAGVVQEIRVSVGQTVDAEMVLAVIGEG